MKDMPHCPWNLSCPVSLITATSGWHIPRKIIIKMQVPLPQFKQRCWLPEEETPMTFLPWVQGQTPAQRWGPRLDAAALLPGDLWGGLALADSRAFPAWKLFPHSHHRLISYVSLLASSKCKSGKGTKASIFSGLFPSHLCSPQNHF